MTLSLFLSPGELADLTDTRVRRLQVAWLDKNGWCYSISRMGNPKILRRYVEQRLGMGRRAVQLDNEPDFSAWMTG